MKKIPYSFLLADLVYVDVLTLWRKLGRKEHHVSSSTPELQERERKPIGGRRLPPWAASTPHRLRPSARTPFGIRTATQSGRGRPERLCKAEGASGAPDWHLQGIEGVFQGEVRVDLVDLAKKGLDAGLPRVSQHHELDPCGGKGRARPRGGWRPSARRPRPGRGYLSASGSSAA